MRPVVTTALGVIVAAGLGGGRAGGQAPPARPQPPLTPGQAVVVGRVVEAGTTTGVPDALVILSDPALGPGLNGTSKFEVRRLRSRVANLRRQRYDAVHRRYQEGAMAHTYEELKKKTVAELREIAKDIHHDAVQGYTQMNKEHLLPALCKALGIEAHEHHAAALAHKATLKSRLRALKAERAKALASGDHELLHSARREYHHLNHALRSSAKRTMLH
jgi:hypothetical protein